MLSTRDDIIISIIAILLCILIIWYYYKIGGIIHVPDIHALQI